jgi:signal transduction histidine kinase/putative methionine-R-sulfoxide reductase with GAF domain
MKFNHKLRNKFVWMSARAVLITTLVLSGLFIYYIIYQNKQDAEIFQQRAYEKARLKVKDQVEMVFSLVENSYQKVDDKDYVVKIYGNQLKPVVDLAENIIREEIKFGKAKNLAEGIVRKNALKRLSDLRYGSNNNYVFIIDTLGPVPRQVMNPSSPENDGSILNNQKFNLTKGTGANIFKSMRQLAMNNREGYIEYTWANAVNREAEIPKEKISYIRLFPEWGWIIGTGILKENIKDILIAEIRDNVAAIRFDEGTGYPFIINDELPYPKALLHPIKPQLNGQYLKGDIFNTLKNSNGKNFTSRLVQNALSDSLNQVVEYRWPKINGDSLGSKMAYARHFEPLGWVITSSIYTDGIKETLAADKARSDQQLRSMVITVCLVALVILGITLFISWRFSTAVANAVITVSNRLKSLARGKKTEKVAVNRKDELGIMADSMNALTDLIRNYATFAESIGEGKLNVTLNQQVHEEDELGNVLLGMQSNLKKIRKEDETRQWRNEGISLMNDLLRNNKQDLDALSSTLLSELIKYVNANQGGIFTVEQVADEEKIVPRACYAFNRNKYLKTTINPGEGIIGQTIKEQKYTLLKEVPENYIHIGSGLGDARPRSVLVMPIVSNETCYGAMELAAFHEFSEQEIAFIERVCENYGAEVATLKNNEKTAKLLSEAQQMAEKLQAQEEELRQNQEEMQATQEEMERRMKEIQEENQQLKQELSVAGN